MPLLPGAGAKDAMGDHAVTTRNPGPVFEPYPPLDRTDLTERTYAVLKERILKRRMAPGERISVPEVASALGVSRTPVNDALKRLAGEGLVAIQARRGTFVTGLNAPDVAELFDIRLMIECHAADVIVCQGKVEALLCAIEPPMAKMREAMVNGDYADYETFVAGDRDLHLAMVQVVGNARLLQVYSDLNVHIQVARAHYADSVENARQAYQEHEAIIECFKAGDAEQVKGALRAHVTHVKDRILEVLAVRGGSL